MKESTFFFGMEGSKEGAMSEEARGRGLQPHEDWVNRAREAARGLGVPEAEMREETRRAIMVLAAQKIAAEEMEAWFRRSAQEPPCEGERAEGDTSR
jgi:hypothetical protein